MLSRVLVASRAPVLCRASCVRRSVSAAATRASRSLTLHLSSFANGSGSASPAFAPFHRSTSCAARSYSESAAPSYQVFETVVSVLAPSGELLVEPQPLLFIDGMQHVPPGLERAARSLAVGEQKKFDVKAAEAFGEKGEPTIIARKDFPDATVAVGKRYRNEHDGLVYTVTAVSDTEVHFDASHELAGRDLVFEVTLVSKRAATRDEIAHGHVHGPGGHHHH